MHMYSKAVCLPLSCHNEYVFQSRVPITVSETVTITVSETVCVTLTCVTAAAARLRRGKER